MSLTQRAEQFLELPSGILSGEARIEIEGMRQVIVTGACEILEYEPMLVRLNTRSGEVRIRGDRLTLDGLHSNSVAVSGSILSVELG